MADGEPEVAEQGSRTIPVILPNAVEPVKIPLFVRNYSHIDLRFGHANAMQQLAKGVDAAKFRR